MRELGLKALGVGLCLLLAVGCGVLFYLMDRRDKRRREAQGWTGRHRR